MAREFGGYCQREDSFNEHLKLTLIRVAQIVASIPDKARSRAPTSLASQYPFFFISCGLFSRIVWSVVLSQVFARMMNGILLYCKHSSCLTLGWSL